MKDLFDQTVSTASAAAAAHYDQAVDAQLHAWPGALPALQAAIAEDPGFALPQALLALVLAGRGERAPALQALAAAQARVAGTTPREQAQVALLAAVVEGRVHDALVLVQAHAREYPADLLAASTALGAYGLFAFSGRADHDAARLAFVESLAPHHPPGRPWLLAQRGWARIEAGRVDEGLAMAQQALALRPHNGGNAHVIVHGLFESGRHADTLDVHRGLAARLPRRWRDVGPPALARGAGRAGAGRRGRGAGAAARPGGRLPAARHALHGPARRGVAAVAPGTARPPRAALGDGAAARRTPLPAGFQPLRRTAPGTAGRGPGSNAPRWTRWPARLPALQARGLDGAAVVLQTVQALVALQQGDAAAAQQALDAACTGAVRLGGSHAQRQLLPLTAAAAAAQRDTPMWGLAQDA